MNLAPLVPQLAMNGIGCSADGMYCAAGGYIAVDTMSEKAAISSGVQRLVLYLTISAALMKLDPDRAAAS